MKLQELYKPKFSPKLVAPISDYTKDYQASPSREYTERIRNELYKKLEKLGWIFVAEGSYSAVFTNPKKSYILKVNKRTDRGFDRFVEIVHKFRNKHFPVISNEQHLGDQSIYFIEKLQKMPNNLTAEALTDLCDDLISYAKYDEANYKPHSDFTKNYMKKNPELVIACNIIGENSREMDIDMHMGNIMMRKDGTLVIIDPFG